MGPQSSKSFYYKSNYTFFIVVEKQFGSSFKRNQRQTISRRKCEKGKVPCQNRDSF